MGCRYHLDNKKEVFDAETYAILRALKIFDRRQGVWPLLHHFRGFDRGHQPNPVGRHWPRPALGQGCDLLKGCAEI